MRRRSPTWSTYSTHASDVETVIVEGRLVVEHGTVLTLDAGAVRRRAKQYQSALAPLH